MENKYFYKANKIRSEGQPLIEKIEKHPDETLHIIDYSYVSADDETFTKNPKFTVHETEQEALDEIRLYLGGARAKAIERRRKLARQVEVYWNKLERLDRNVLEACRSTQELHQILGSEPPYQHDWVPVPPFPKIPEPEAENRKHPGWPDFVERTRRIGRIGHRMRRVRN